MSIPTLRFYFIAALLMFTCVSNAQVPGISANKLFGRKYKLGDIYRYKLTMEEFHNGKWDHTNIAVCELKVTKDSAGIFCDEVHWISKTTITPTDTTEATKAALSVKPYLISLDPGGRLDLPKIEVPDMTEPIQDFNTFFVAVSPLTGTATLTKKADSSSIPQPVKADFSNGAFILKGEDCIDISVKLTDITKKYVLLHTSFSPPRQPCLSFILPEMNTPVTADTINNFQMLAQQGPDQYLVQYGSEFFYINSTLQRSDGKIIKATMFNKLDLKLKINCDKGYKKCQYEMPFSEQRNLTLELL